MLPCCHGDRVNNNVSAHMVSDRPANDPTRPCIQDDGEAHLPGAGRVLRHVHDPQPVRAFRRELAFHEVIVGFRAVTAGAPGPERRLVEPDDPGLPHQTLDPGFADPNLTPEPQLVTDPV